MTRKRVYRQRRGKQWGRHESDEKLFNDVSEMPVRLRRHARQIIAPYNSDWRLTASMLIHESAISSVRGLPVWLVRFLALSMLAYPIQQALGLDPPSLVRLLGG